MPSTPTLTMTIGSRWHGLHHETDGGDDGLRFGMSGRPAATSIWRASAADAGARSTMMGRCR